MINLEVRKTELAKARGVSTEDLVSDAEFIVTDKEYFINIYGSHIAFWEAVIEWSKEEFSHTRDIPMSRLAEKQVLLQALNGCDIKFMSADDHTRLFAALSNVLNGSATTLAINRSKGGQATRKLTSEKIQDILKRYYELEKIYPHRLKDAHICTLASEFKLSETSIKSILPKKVKR